MPQFTAKNRKALHEAAEQQRDQIYEALAPHFQNGPRGGYHRRCYQTYTNKTFLVRLQRHGKKRKQPDRTATSFSTVPAIMKTTAQMLCACAVAQIFKPLISLHNSSNNKKEV